MGGGFILDFDASAVNIIDVSFNETFFGFKALAGTWGNIAGTLRGSGFGELWGIDNASSQVATVESQAVGIGSRPLDLERGPFNFRDQPGDLINDDVPFIDGSTTVVPLPAAWLLMLSAGLLGVLVRKRR